MLNKKTMVYFAQIEPKTDLGVLKKISGVVDSAKKINIDARLDVIEDLSYKGIFALCKKMIQCSENIIMLRSCGIYMFMLIPVFLFLRLFTKKKIIIDIPTPISIFVLESRVRRRAFYKMFIFELLIRISYPMSLWFAHKVIQYGQESRVFSMGLASKMQRMSNGVDVSSLASRVDIPVLTNQITFVSVANIANWHGYDRLIKGIAEYNQQQMQSNVGFIKAKFIVIGAGGELTVLKKMVEDFNLGSCIDFVGVKKGVDLQSYYQISHIAVASLALHRKNINKASELKAREYTSIGIPFLMTAIDDDFKDDLNFIYRLDSSEETIDISSIIQWYQKLNFSREDAQNMRQYALNNLDFLVKIRQILDFEE